MEIGEDSYTHMHTNNHSHSLLLVAFSIVFVVVVVLIGCEKSRWQVCLMNNLMPAQKKFKFNIRHKGKFQGLHNLLNYLKYLRSVTAIS